MGNFKLNFKFHTLNMKFALAALIGAIQAKGPVDGGGADCSTEACKTGLKCASHDYTNLNLEAMDGTLRGELVKFETLFGKPPDKSNWDSSIAEGMDATAAAAAVAKYSALYFDKFCVSANHCTQTDEEILALGGV